MLTSYAGLQILPVTAEFVLDDKIEVTIDGESDVEMTANKLAPYRTQLGDYRKQTSAEQALVVLTTAGTVRNV